MSATVGQAWQAGHPLGKFRAGLGYPQPALFRSILTLRSIHLPSRDSKRAPTSDPPMGWKLESDVRPGVPIGQHGDVSNRIDKLDLCHTRRLFTQRADQIVVIGRVFLQLSSRQ
jgi:hypothetical protein